MIIQIIPKGRHMAGNYFCILVISLLVIVFIAGIVLKKLSNAHKLPHDYSPQYIYLALSELNRVKLRHKYTK